MATATRRAENVGRTPENAIRATASVGREKIGRAEIAA